MIQFYLSQASGKWVSAKTVEQLQTNSSVHIIYYADELYKHTDLELFIFNGKVTELCKQLLVEAEPNFGECLLTEVNSLNEKWAQTVKLAQEQNKRLIMALKSSESMPLCIQM
jgi:diacylglycerol kinase family enzyme